MNIRLVSVLFVFLLVLAEQISQAEAQADKQRADIKNQTVTTGNISGNSTVNINQIQGTPTEKFEKVVDENQKLIKAAKDAYNAGKRAFETTKNTMIQQPMRPEEAAKRVLYELAADGRQLIRNYLENDGGTMEELEARAKRGDPEGLYLLGVSKWRGIGTKADEHAATSLLRRAAMAGFNRARMAYSTMLLGGIGTAPEKEEALSLLKDCDRERFAPCATALGQYYAYELPEGQRDYIKARTYLEKAASKGNVGAISTLGDFAWFGTGQPANKEEAIKKYEQATVGCSTGVIERCSLGALTQLALTFQWGAVYPSGKSRPVDKTRALEIYRRAASLGDSQAPLEAASMLIAGDGVEKNTRDAASILIQAADRGNWKAVAKLSFLVINKQLESVEGRDLETMAIEADEHGYPEGISALVGSMANGKNGWKLDLQRASSLAVRAYSNIQKQSMSEEGRWPMYAKGFAYVIQQAEAQSLLNNKDMASYFPESIFSDLKRKYYSKAEGMKRFTVPIDCGGIPTPFEVYIWESEDPISPLREQFDWIKQARGCDAPKDVIESFEKLFKIAKENNVSFVDLSVYALAKQDDKK